MLTPNQWKVLLALVFFVATGIAAARLPGARPRNLKVLPKDISDAVLDSLMQTYNKALGVGCGFCHSKHATVPDSLDYAADNNAMKEEGRRMIRLTMNLNFEYFNFDKSKHPAYLTRVSCNTCHRGEAYPEAD